MRRLALLPATKPHKIGVVVPRGGSSCVSCKFVRNYGTECVRRAWVLAPASKGGGGGDTKLPVAANRWCCDLWELSTEDR